MAKTKLYTFYMSPYGAPAKHVVKMASLVVTCMPSSNLDRTKHQRSGQVYRIILLLTTAPRLVEFVWPLYK